ncbi:probable basic-leucine zipper transcription factor R [Bactrocera neohumeralis]|uniref:probable basic-leucine zipper transcription factor R n=1 Tax=Bactrocera neohumeralis TaxID=98809 RepID=UPI0021658952|nr:probable basic-leucine zipper transcription factor R [Bactrocera neohumeralis]XP_050330182.1 probable basic-leucine zipper transcription factor R [Bactrocera neohumeralis]
MSEEHQQQQKQQQQQQQQQQHQRQQLLQQQQQQQKCSKETAISNSSSASCSPTNATSTAPPRKSNIHEMCNQDFVSRLMAATPPYLYSTPVGANNFFFSDMLRSLVQARNNENARNLQLQQSMVLARRPRKRTWAHHRPYYEHLRERKEAEEKQQLLTQQQQQQLNNNATVSAVGLEKPLELTNKPYFHLANKYRKLENESKDVTDVKIVKCDTIGIPTPEVVAATALNKSGNERGGAAEAVLQDTPPAASLPPQDLVLPPPPPVWYPPLYPPYGIDPLHFFIDLRVSGHIYDRKKENISPLTNVDDNNAAADSEATGSNCSNVNLLNKHRQGSAFTVPVPRCNDNKPAVVHALDAINLTSTAMASKFENYTKYYDLGEAKENQPLTKSSASYMLQQLPRLYSQFAARDLIASNVAAAVGGGNANSFDNDNKSEPDCEDSDERASVDNCPSLVGNNCERDIDVEIIDSIKYRTDGDNSRCSSADEASITQID